MSDLKGLPLKANNFQQIETKDGFVVAHNVRPSDIQYIVTAANMFPELVEALEKTIVNVTYESTKNGLKPPKWLKDINALYKKVKT